MRVRWACSGGHGAVPAWAGCLMILGLYPASSQAEPTTGRANTPDLIASCAHFTRAVARFGSHTDAQPVPHHRATTIAARHLSLSWWVSPTPFILSSVGHDLELSFRRHLPCPGFAAAIHQHPGCAHAQLEEQHYALQHSLPNGVLPALHQLLGAWSVQRGQKAPFGAPQIRQLVGVLVDAHR